MSQGGTRTDRDLGLKPPDDGLDNEIGEKIEVIQVENATQQLNTVDFELLSRNSIDLKSKAALRLFGVIVIWGISK